MIDRTCFERKWILDKYRETNADPLLIERAIYAFELLGNLVESGINLISHLSVRLSWKHRERSY